MFPFYQISSGCFKCISTWTVEAIGVCTAHALPSRRLPHRSSDILHDVVASPTIASGLEYCIKIFQHLADRTDLQRLRSDLFGLLSMSMK